MPLEPRACIDGVPSALADARIPVTDQGFARGYGAQETIGVWDGAPFRLDEHLERLSASLATILLPPADIDVLRADAECLLEAGGEVGDAVLRVYVTASGTRVVILEAVPTQPAPTHLQPMEAHWIRPRPDGSAAPKTMSALPNLLASQSAKAAEADDALLLSTEGHVLEGPTFAVSWTTDRTLFAPSLELGLVDSVSQRLVLEVAKDLGLEVAPGAYPLKDLLDADEVTACSTSRDLIAVRRIGDTIFDGPTPVRDRISTSLWEIRRGQR